ncbi:hypothetical protein [Salipiger sp.]|uniref:hypothetical protein n=1 Tax=Salipiger sp. TaxID=2078585 RepID=UPI003A9809D2
MPNIRGAILGGAIGLSAIAASAETILFEHDDSVLIVRGRDAGGDARYEFLANGKDRLQCVALGPDGAPLAVEASFADAGFVRFDDLAISAIDRVICRRQD